jgi:hypothetical protein
MNWDNERGLEMRVGTPSRFLGTPEVTFAEPFVMEAGVLYVLKLDTESCIARLYEKDSGKLVKETTYTRKEPPNTFVEIE